MSLIAQVDIYIIPQYQVIDLNQANNKQLTEYKCGMESLN